MAASHVPTFIEELRLLKVDESSPSVPENLEIVYSPKSNFGLYSGKMARLDDLSDSLFTAILLFSNPTRLVRPVKNLRVNKREYIGPHEQLFMEIAVVPKEFIVGVTTHMV